MRETLLERAQTLFERIHALFERVHALLERGETVIDRGQTLFQTLFERGLILFQALFERSLVPFQVPAQGALPVQDDSGERDADGEDGDEFRAHGRRLPRAPERRNGAIPGATGQDTGPPAIVRPRRMIRRVSRQSGTSSIPETAAQRTSAASLAARAVPDTQTAAKSTRV